MRSNDEVPMSVRQHGLPRDVLDWISWMQHVAYVHGLCDTTTTAIAVFDCFKRSASAERGSRIEGIATIERRSAST